MDEEVHRGTGSLMPVSGLEDLRRMLPMRRDLRRRFLTRVELLWRWLIRMVLPRYWGRLLISMGLRTVGSLAEAASFLVAAHLLIDWASMEGLVPTALDQPLLIVGALLLALLFIGAFSRYLGDRIASRVAVDFEREAFVDAIGIARRHPKGGADALSAEQTKDLFSSAPRFMSRVVLQIVGVGTAAVLLVVGAAVCFLTFPALSALLAALVLVTSPAYVYHAVHSTNVGHRFREAASAHSLAARDLQRKGLSAAKFNRKVLLREARKSQGYSGFLDAYGQRLMIAPVSHLIVNSMMAVCILAALIWTGMYTGIDAGSFSSLIVYLVFLRVFFSGLNSIINAIQITATFVPSFRLYLELDPRMQTMPK